MDKIVIKNSKEIEIMTQVGKKLGEIKKNLLENIHSGINALEIDALAQKLIENAGGVPSFKMVRDYKWSTCINVNDGVVHGVPKKDTVFKKGDIVSIDVGMYKDGFHSDCSSSLLIGNDPKKEKFLEAGRLTLKDAINQAKVGNKVRDISFAIESTLKKRGLTPIRALVGHGIGRELHESPAIPCFVSDSKDQDTRLEDGLVLAIEVMYTIGSPDLILDKDGWTIRTRNGKISGLYEETVAVKAGGPFVLTE